MEDIPVIKEYNIATYFQKLSEDSLYPSAGSSSAITTAHAAALFAMACRVNLRNIEKGPSKGVADGDRKVFWQKALHDAEVLLEQSLDLAQADGFAIKSFVEGDPGGAKKATEIPLQIACCAGKIMTLAGDTLPRSYAPVKADVESARCLAEGGLKAALTVARYNLLLLDQRAKENYTKQISELEHSFQTKKTHGL